MTLRPLIAAIAAIFAAAAAHAAEPTGVFINGEEVDEATLATLVQLTGAPIPAARYWYDGAAGVWGYEGGPMAGSTVAGLAIGGALKPGASGGGSGRTTGVFVNGREIHSYEYQYLQSLFGAVYPGRYWLNAAGIGGLEGGPPAYDLAAAARQAAARRNPNGSVYTPGIGGQPGIGVGQASDGCTYVSYGGYSNGFC